MFDIQIVKSKQLITPQSVSAVPSQAKVLIKSSTGTIQGGILTDSTVANFLGLTTNGESAAPATGDDVVVTSGPNAGQQFKVVTVGITSVVLEGQPANDINVSYQIQRVVFIPGAPIVLDIRAANLNTITEVRINDVRSPDVVIISSKQLLAQVPDTVSALTQVRLIEMVSSLPISRDAAKLFFEFGETPVRVQGIQKLVQLVIKVLLTTPGRDLFDPNHGGGFLAQVGRTMSRMNSAGIMTDLTVGITQTQTQIVESQSQDTAIPQDERLLSLDLVDAQFDDPSASIFVAIRVISVAGEEAVTRLFV